MNCYLEIFFTTFVSEDFLGYSKKVLDITYDNRDPDEIVLEVITNRRNGMPSILGNKFISHSTSWRYEQDGSICLTYVVFSDYIDFSGNKVYTLKMHEVEISCTNSPNRPRPQCLKGYTAGRNNYFFCRCSSFPLSPFLCKETDMIRIQGLSFSYAGNEVLKEVTFSVSGGEMVSIIGVNGSGKTTLLKNINRLLTPKRGTVYLDGKDTSLMGQNEIARLIGYMPQKSNGVACTVFDAVLLGRKPYLGWNVTKKDIEKTYEILELMEIKDYAMRNTFELSGGELQKVMIARALAQEPKVLLLDEPVNHLDIRNQMEVLKHIKDVTKELQIATLAVMHDLNLALRFSDRFIMMKDGKVFASGGREVITSESIKAVYQIEADIYEVSGIPIVIPRNSICRNKKL
jgi:iron complex transport system ATP-binding protein